MWSTCIAKPRPCAYSSIIAVNKNVIQNLFLTFGVLYMCVRYVLDGSQLQGNELQMGLCIIGLTLQVEY